MTQLNPHKQRAFAMQLVAELRGAGFEALWAGGCVRDQLLGLVPKDYDVATNATPEEVRKLFGRRRTIPMGASFGVMTVLGLSGAGQIEVATFRTDGRYSDGRHPDRVEYSDAEHDAARRDFTINGLFYDPIADEIHDYVGGQADLAAGLIRAIGDPEARIAEDNLRMLRAVRFAARFDFAVDPATRAAVIHNAGNILQVSGERIGAEMRTMLEHPHRTAALRLLRTLSLEPYVLPETTGLCGEAWDLVLQRLERLESPSFATVLAALLYPGEVSNRVAEIAGRWKLANREVDRVVWLLGALPAALRAITTPWPKLQRLLVHEGAADLMTLAVGVAGRGDASIEFCRSKLALPPGNLNPPPLITGGDLIAAGFTPGPRFSMLLQRVRDAQLDGTITTKDEALALARGNDH